MKIDLIKKGDYFVIPEYEEEVAKLIWYDETVTATIKKIRNPEFHKKFWTMFGFVFKNQEKYKTKKDLETELKIRTGLYDEYITAEGKLVYIPGSISFAKMDEIQFRQYYSQAIDAFISMDLGWTDVEANIMADRILLGWG